jgi:hypothetical protein
MKKYVQKSFWGVFVNFLGHLFFIVGYFWLILTSEYDSFFDSIIPILAFLLSVIFIYNLCLYFFQLTTKIPTVIISEEGITKNFSGFNSLYLRWEEIDSIRIISRFFNKYIVLKSKEKEKLVKNLPWYNKFHFYLNKWYLDEYIVIPMNDISYETAGNTNEFHELLKGYWENSRIIVE